MQRKVEHGVPGIRLTQVLFSRPHPTRGSRTPLSDIPQAFVERVPVPAYRKALRRRCSFPLQTRRRPRQCRQSDPVRVRQPGRRPASSFGCSSCCARCTPPRRALLHRAPDRVVSGLMTAAAALP
ncbi:hypothetical protein B0H17DRAFT_1186827 [Mycena rosella]|uniref:Uncharacterized protein n=1 Tax=Mycena rosella TaxID=1033263 RepID=A0AAD7CDH6_MYCRO|nr:hypothetical protein B0H17DRAFT_1186827 [Mycena rosella]